ncbi:MAG: M23 family metallopeptidase [Lachnospiraceae bacterium]
MKSDRLIILLFCVMLAAVSVPLFRDQKHAVNETKEVSSDTQEMDYIKWVEFNVTCEAMKKAFQYDLNTYGKETHLNWVSLLSYLGAKYGGDFSRYREKDLDEIAELLLNGEQTEKALEEEMKYYSYYREAYGAVLDGMAGEYEKEDEEGWKTVYGLKAYHPIAKGFPYSDYDDFGVSRSYGYKRNHLGHDMMGQVGTPIIAVESGYVAELGWNQYGGWRIGINSFDGKRYYYYAHLRQNRPYAEGLDKGDIVQAGDVIGYLGRTGYSKKENVNNIDEYHLHFGLQLIFDESQREGNHEIWVSGYELVKFLCQHRSEVQRNDETKEWTRTYQTRDPAAASYLAGNSF